MPITRRHALSSLAAAAVAPAALARWSASPALLADLASCTDDPTDAAANEDFWGTVARAFTVDRSLINLNNGGVSPAPAVVQDAMKRHLDFCNTMPPPIALWQTLKPHREGVRQRLARAWGIDPEEIAITRNASEGLQVCQFGHDLSPGDEVLCTTHDYPRMINTFKQRERREGIVLKQFDIPVPCEDDDEIVRRYEANITPRTKLILVSHAVFLTGQILPAGKVAALGRRRGIPVIVDGAHALAHFDFSLGDLGADFYATSLHKWLFAPHGTGMLFVRRDKIGSLWPLMAADEAQKDDIRKFEEIGTHPIANPLAIAEALTFHEAIGPARKQARLTLLRDRWARRLLDHSGRVKLFTSLRPGFACGIATVGVEGLDMAALQSWLWNDKRILTVRIDHAPIDGLRISPSVYTTLQEIDRLADALEFAIASGLPS